LYVLGKERCHKTSVSGSLFQRCQQLGLASPGRTKDNQATESASRDAAQIPIDASQDCLLIYG
jgi:hypothetical protein